jgi:hypothetical protein
VDDTRVETVALSSPEVVVPPLEEVVLPLEEIIPPLEDVCCGPCVEVEGLPANSRYAAALQMRTITTTTEITSGPDAVPVRNAPQPGLR